MTWLIQRAASIAFNIVLLVVAWHYRYEIKAVVIQAIHFVTKP
jgi:hypothetical protein